MALWQARPDWPHVVIVGGGFGGLEAAKALAMAALSPGDIAAPIRAVLRQQRNTRVLLAEVTAIDLAGRSVNLADGERLSYDYLILAAGSRTSFFGHDEWEPLAPGLKTIDDALELRRRVLIAY